MESGNLHYGIYSEKSAAQYGYCIWRDTNGNKVHITTVGEITSDTSIQEGLDDYKRLVLMETLP